MYTFLQCALVYNAMKSRYAFHFCPVYDATIYTTVQCNELQILSDENFLHYKCCTVLFSSALQTVQRYVQHLLKLCCSAAHCKMHPFALNCSFQIVHSSALHFVWGATFLSWTDGKWDLIEIAAEIQNRFRIGGNIWLRFPPCSYETPSAVRNTVALGYEGNTVV